MKHEKPMQGKPDELASTVPAAERLGTEGAVLESHSVLRGHQAITIAHNGSFYRLQTTRQGKLILTK
ncbi:MAG: hemin uptake protein HemP [Hydrogenophaga sp.]|jgi:hemin uptake protein HemP|nr:hemin uptake protein HemP [Hydrogenophaga sp.]